MHRLPKHRVAFAIAAISAALFACGRPAGKPAPATAAPLATVTVHASPAPLERVVDGTVEAVNQATVSAQTSGRVAEIRYDVNDVVPAGAVIMRLKGTEQRATQSAAESAVREARARETEAEATYQRIAQMYERRVVSRAQLDQATAARDAAAARRTATEAALATAREGVGYTEVRAPYGGVVTKRFVEVGELVNPGTPLMAGLSLKDLRVSTYIPQAVLAQVHETGKAAIYVGDRRIEAAKLTIFPEAATTSGAIRARLEFAPGAIDVVPGLYVRVGLVVGRTTSLRVPNSALVEQSEVTAVYVIDDHGQPTLRYVRPGRRSADATEILAGLSDGEKVAVDANAAATWMRAAGGTP